MKRLVNIIIWVVFISALFYWGFNNNILSLLSEGSIHQVVDVIHSYGIAAPLLSILLMILQAIAAPIPSFLITGANGIVFGVFWGIIISWIGAMLGALVSYYIARWFGYRFINKFLKDKNWYQKIDRLLRNHAFMTILVARLVPLISFDAVSFAAGLNAMKLRLFLLATGIGMLPGTVAYTILGHDLVQIDEYRLRFIFVSVFIVFVILIGYLLRNKLFPDKY